jgi:hypothetical protein
MVLYRDATASSFVAKVRGEAFGNLHAVAVKVTVVCESECLVCHDDFFINKPLNAKENEEHAFYFALHVYHLFLTH